MSWSRVSGSTDAEPSLPTDGFELYLAVKGMDSRAAVWFVDGHLYVVVRGSDNGIYYTYRIRPSTYAPWDILGGATFSALSAHDQH